MVPKGNHTIKISYLGYKMQTIKILVTKDTKLEIQAHKSNVSINEVTVKAEKIDQNIRSTNVGAVTIKAKEINKLPSMFGEPDVIKPLN